MSPTTYKDSGVDLEVYEQAMKRLPKLMHRTFSPRVLNNDGGFAGLFQLDFNCDLFKRNYDEPVLVSGTDGVGTKLKVAQMTGRHDTVGIDLVAMCVNDVLCCGAEPLFFLDYVAMSRDNPELLEQIVTGISEGCMQSDASLLGGETAIMPDLYQGDDYDLAGFCVGIADKKNLVDGKAIQPGDVVIGIESSGFHSNGYSLVRKVVFELAELKPDDHVEELCQTVGEALMTPTHIYAKLTGQLLRDESLRPGVHGIAHITGGGLLENSQRILGSEIDLELIASSWEVPDCFTWVQRLGQIAPEEMGKVFNMGLGLALVVAPDIAERVTAIAHELGYRSWTVGQAVNGSGQSRWV